jgi:hypothetical protein
MTWYKLSVLFRLNEDAEYLYFGNFAAPNTYQKIFSSLNDATAQKNQACYYYFDNFSLTEVLSTEQIPIAMSKVSTESTLAKLNETIILRNVLFETNKARKAEISDATSGKIKKGLPVYMRLDAFPAQEFGTLSGVIENIAAVPQHDTYSIQIALPKQLKTNYQKTIPFRPEMKGLVKIVTQERRLIEHLLDSFRNLLKNE